MSASRTPVFDQHRQKLRESFADRVKGAGAERVLDVGAGNGALVEALVSRGMAAIGVEPNAPEDSLLIRADADALPFEDGAFDTVTLRHVLHHLDDPRAAFEEASRVASRRVVVAEPYKTIPMAPFLAMRDLDLLLRRLDRASGMVHDDDVPPETIESWVSGGATAGRHLDRPITPLPPGEVQAMVEAAARGRTLDADDQVERDRLIAHATAGPGVFASPSMILLVTLPTAE